MKRRKERRKHGEGGKVKTEGRLNKKERGENGRKEGQINSEDVMKGTSVGEETKITGRKKEMG